MTSGQVELIGHIPNWDEVKSFLFSEETPKSVEPEDDWNNTDWGWGEDDTNRTKGVQQEAKENENFKKKSDLWAQNFVIANSPMGNLLVIVNGSKAAFFMSEWDPKNSRMRFSKSFQGDVAQEEGEKVTSAICIPLLCKKKTSPGAPDWTCILLGFNTGHVRMYTENGNNLVNQLFHNQPVMSFKCRSYQPAYNSSDHDQLEEVFVVYGSRDVRGVIVTMDGFGLFQTLRACRNHLARLQANVAETMIDPPPLSYKKWQYDKGETINDCEGIGLQTPGTFEHLYTASVIGGLRAKCQSAPLTSYIFVSTGNNPYAAFHYAQEGQAVPVLAEIAYAMASKLKSSLLNAASGWLGFGGSAKAPPPKDTPQIEPATSMSCRFGLFDHRRVGQSLLVSPCRKLSVLTDTLARVILIDNNLGIVVRMWKGYREAQCGWLQVEEEVSSRSKAAPRKALFLVIYSPKRGHLEVFAMQQGPKVASFGVTKNGRLLSTTFGMMGLNNIPIKGGNKPLTPCLFIDSNAQLFSLNIPFHLALCDKSSSKVKDIHLLKTLQRLLKDHEPSTQEIMELLKEIRLQSMINQAFKILAHNAHKCANKETLREVLENYLELFCDQEEKDLSVVFRLQSLLELYIFLVESASKPPEYSSKMGGTNEDSHDLTVLQCLHSTKKEMKVLQDMARKNTLNHKKTKLVTFEDDLKFISLNEFFSSFCLEFDTNKAKASKVKSDHRIKLNHKHELSSSLGSLIFCGVLNNKSDINEWKIRLKNSSLIPMELMSLALTYWCEIALLSSSHVDLMEQLYHALTALSELEDPANVTNEFSRVSSWWENMRKEISKSSQVFHIYSFAIVCRGVAIDLQNQAETAARESGKKKSLDENSEPAMDTEPQASSSSSIPQIETSEESIMNNSGVCAEEWETVSLDLLKWNILLKQIEDLSLLSATLVQRPKLENPALPILSNELDDLSVLNLLDKGKGCIAELVGKWLTTIGIDPVLVQDEMESKKKKSADAPPSPEPKGKYRKTKVGPVEEEHHPKDKLEKEPEAETGAEAVEVNKGTAYVQDLIRILKDNFSVSLSSSIILANYAWEYCLEWNKDTNEVIFLSSAVQCVNAIPDSHIKQGIMSMMWSTFLVKAFCTLVSSGHGHVAAKEKLADRFSGFSSPEKQENFLGLCVSFLDSFMETNVMCEGSQPQSNMMTKKNHWSNDVSSASLTDLALVQPPSNYDMILIHYQLALVAHFSHKFNIKRTSMRPTNLFDTKSRMTFFQSLSSQVPYASSSRMNRAVDPEVDLGLKILREEFLCLVISNAIHEIQEDISDDYDSGKSSDDSSSEFKSVVPSLDGVKECETWIQKCFDLGRIWGLDLDSLRMNQVCEFYSSGFDLLGLEMISSVSSKDLLGAKLLVIAGMRINFIIDNNSTLNVTEIVSSISTNLSNWLKSLNYSKLRCLRFSKQSISELAQQLMHLIPETSYDYKLAEELLLSSNFL